MTLTVQTPKTTPVVGDGVNKLFTYGFRVDYLSDLRIVVTRISDGFKTVYSSNFTATNLGNNGGGQVTYPTVGDALANTHNISIERATLLQQDLDLSGQGGFHPKTIEAALDRNMMIQQEYQRDVDSLEDRTSDIENGMEFSEAFALAMTALRDETDAARDETVAAAASVNVDADLVNVAKTAAEAAAAAAALSAGTAANAALASDYYPAAQTNLPRGVVGHSALAGGSGGANGTFALAFSGGNFAVNPVGTFTVAGGAVTAINITDRGLYVGASPTAPTFVFTASAGLTGASATPTVGFLVEAGEYYWTDHATDATLLSAYYRNASAPAISSPLVTLPRTNYFNLLGSQKIGKASPSAIGTSWVANVSIIQAVPAVHNGFVQSGTIVVNADTAVHIFAARLISGSTFERLTNPPKIFNLVAGVNNLTDIGVPIEAGQYVGIYLASGGTYYTSAGGTNSYYVTGQVGASTAMTAFSGVMEFNLTTENETLGGQHVDAKNIADLQTAMGETQTHGNVVSPVITRHVGFAGYTWTSPYPAQFAGRAQRCLLDVNVAQQATFKAITLNGDGTLTATAEVDVSLSSAGSQEVFFDLDVAQGQYIGVVLPLSGLAYSTSASPKLAWFSNTEVTTSTAKTITTAWSTALEFIINSATLADVQRHERRIDALEALPAAARQWDGEMWAALGDSLTAQNNWTAPVAAALGATLQNLGISGGAFAGNGVIRQSFPSIAVGTKLITLMVQCNDFAGGVVLGTRYTEYNGTQTTFYAALYEAVTWLQTNFPAARVVLMTEHAAGAGFGTAPQIAATNARNLFATASGGTKVPDWQMAIQHVAADTGCGFIDVGREGGLGYLTCDASTTQDGLHPNAAGGLLWADYIAPRLNAMKQVP